MTGAEWLAAAPLLIAVATGIIVVLADAFGARTAAIVLGGTGLAAAAVVAARGAAELELVLVRETVLAGGGISASAAVLLALAALSLLGGLADLRARANGGGIAALICLGSAGALLLAGSIDLALTFVALETVALCGYAVVAGARSRRATEAGMKYFIQGAVATGLFLAGFAIHVGAVGGSAGFGGVAQGIGRYGLAATAASVFLVSAFAFKLGAVPFHSWAPDAYETAPPAGAAFLATSPKIAAALGLALLSVATMEGAAEAGVATIAPAWILGLIALGSIVIGTFAGLAQTDYARMLGYSGIAQIGYVLVGLSLGSQVLAATLVLLAVYGIAAAGAFVSAAAIRSVRPQWDGSIQGLAGLGLAHPVLGISLAVMMLSLTGIPLTAGFWGKFFVFTFAISSGMPWMQLLVIVALLGSVISFGYYGRVMRAVFFDSHDPAGQGASADETSATTTEPSEAAPVKSDPWAFGGAFVTALALLGIGIAPLFTGLMPLLEWFTISS